MMDRCNLGSRDVSRWAGLIRGEWWLTPEGDAEFADQDEGDAGHEKIAIDRLLNKDTLIDLITQQLLLEESREKEDLSRQLLLFEEDRERVAELESLRRSEENREKAAVARLIADLESLRRSDEYGASAVYFEYIGLITAEIGAAAAGTLEKWYEIRRDPRLAYAKEGAIAVIGTNFYGWRIDKNAIKRMKSFLYDELDNAADSPEDMSEASRNIEVCVEEASVQRFACFTVEEFLQLKHPGQLWR